MLCYGGTGASAGAGIAIAPPIPAPQKVPSCVLVTPPCLRPLSGQGQLEAPEGWGFTGSGSVPSVKTFVRVFDEKLLSAVQVTMACVGLLSYCAGAQG